jgi:hypothetical protein
MKMTVFWVVAPCSLVDDHRPDDEAASTSETSVNFYQNNNPEYIHLQFILWLFNGGVKTTDVMECTCFYCMFFVVDIVCFFVVVIV